MRPNSKEWNTELINQIFHKFDADEICKIRLPSNEVDDCVAWHYEKAGVFTVKSAYKLADSLRRNETAAGSSSANDPGDRSVWDVIWKANVPEKIKIFSWRVSTQSLATKHNTFRRTIVKEDVCDICGVESENEYHAVIACTRSKALREAMREHWELPKERAFRMTGTDWLQVLLSSQNEQCRHRVLLILWQAWHLRNNVIHVDGRDTVTGAVHFLLRLENELTEIMYAQGTDDSKKPWSLHCPAPSMQIIQTTNQWTAPLMGQVKVNTDAAFLRESGDTLAGVVLLHATTEASFSYLSGDGYPSALRLRTRRLQRF